MLFILAIVLDWVNLRPVGYQLAGSTAPFSKKLQASPTIQAQGIKKVYRLSVNHARHVSANFALASSKGGTEPMRRRHDRPGDGPHQGVILRDTRLRLEDAPDLPAALDHVVIVWSPRPRSALAGVAPDKRGSPFRRGLNFAEGMGRYRD
jgi:hypothetical protein